MAENIFDRLVGEAFSITEGGEMQTFEATGTRERSVANETVVELEPVQGGIPKSLTPAQMESMRERGQLSEPDPRALHEQRSERSQQLDEQFNAPITTDVRKWANNMDHYDFPGVDTGPRFREENPDFETSGFLEQFYDF